MTKMTAQDIEEQFDEFLDEAYKPYNILNPGDPYDRTGIMLYPSAILKNTDEVAYRTFLNNWADQYNIEESDEEDETDNEDEDDESDEECEGHESLNGDMMGVSYYCDGSCKKVNEEDAQEFYSERRFAGE